MYELIVNGTQIIIRQFNGVVSEGTVMMESSFEALLPYYQALTMKHLLSGGQ